MKSRAFVPHTEESILEMLKDLGVDSLEELYWQVVPKEFRYDPKPFPSLAEEEICQKFSDLLSKNCLPKVHFLGGGFYDHYIPAAVGHIVNRSEFYTAYTPYQPEASQGSLKAIYEYQTMICRLTDMEVSNASLYDGGSAIFEAAMMAVRTNQRKKIVVDTAVNPIYRQMLKTYTGSLDLEIKEIPRMDISEAELKDAACLVLQMPDFLGNVFDVGPFSDMAHNSGALSVQVFYPISLALLKPPGQMKVDIAVGEGQSLGLGLNLGGPYLGIMATKKSLVRKMPGRIVGKTVDRNGKEAFVLTLQAREQHIRREKATSNVCSNQSLCALQALVYSLLMGREGLMQVARNSHLNAVYAWNKIRSMGVEFITGDQFFNEFAIKLPNLERFYRICVDAGIIPGLRLYRFYPKMRDGLLLAFTEKTKREDIDRCLDILRSHIRS